MQAEAGLTGGSSDVDVNDPEIKALIAKSIAKIDASMNDGHSHELIRVVSASKQVVSGLKYTLKILVGGEGHQAVSDCSFIDIMQRFARQ
ncbi:unnamed protein product [Anisakis simplex]|uniref:Cystatin domain-containing protein n=1 Tax=Anisakis simplex TaxID=6269 RepID=A0A0M3JZY6_ANISI|nr:unnamed protein product [Anisakis simplex]